MILEKSKTYTLHVFIGKYIYFFLSLLNLQTKTKINIKIDLTGP